MTTDHDAELQDPLAEDFEWSLSVKQEPGVSVNEEPGVSVKEEPGVSVKAEFEEVFQDTCDDTHIIKFCAEPAKKRTRKPNFLPEELKALVFGALQRKIIVNGSINLRLQGAVKRRAWNAVCKEVNAEGTTRRTVGELKNKLKSYKAEVKKEVARYRKQLQQAGQEGPPPMIPPAIMQHFVGIDCDSTMPTTDAGTEADGQLDQQISYQQINHTAVGGDDTDNTEPVDELKPFENPPFLEFFNYCGAAESDVVMTKANKACQTLVPDRGSTSSRGQRQQGDQMLDALNRIGDLLQHSLEQQVDALAQSVENGRRIADTLTAVSSLLHLS